MKKYIVLAMLIVFATVTVSAQEINWVTLEEAVELQKKNPKKKPTVWVIGLGNTKGEPSLE